MNSQQYGDAPTRVNEQSTRKPATWRSSRWYLPIGGALALAWFLVRVIPKPSRATYPCQRAAFPIATGFIVWLLSGWSSLFAFRKARLHVHPARWMMAALCILVATVAGTAFFLDQPTPSLFGQNAPPTQPVFSPTEPVNSPMGVAVGVKPGRVAWVHDPKATSWDGTSNTPGWWDDSNTHPQAVSAMLSGVIRSVGDATTDKEAWTRIFADFNKRAGKGAVSYKKGEKIAIKLNLNQCRNHGDGANASYIAPQLVEALLKQLVTEVGAAPSDITFYDAIRNVPSTIFDRCTKNFPGVHFVDSVGGDRREKAVRATTDALTLVTGGNPIYFPTCVTEATYLINVAGLKGHTMAGMTVCAKNHLGSIFTADGAAAARTLHSTLAVKMGRGGGEAPQQMGTYNSLVDLNGHKELGGKTVLYLIDGLYASKHNEYRLDPTCKWESAPFNGHWTSSLFASQDGIAIDSVALDFLRSEPTLSTIVTGAVDNYLHEAAQANKPPSKTVYDPNKDGKPLASQGVHEHWNNATDKKYSRNLGTGIGIELVSVRASSTVASAE
ncbi:MAG: DUF362 domain-containing protein [Verrucomicrobiia bacterium]